MRVNISPSDVSLCALRGADIHRFVTLLGETEDETFVAVDLKTCWGLLVCVFLGDAGKVTKSVNLDLLWVTKELVISDTGVPVDRYVKIVEELLKDAKRQLVPSVA